MNDAFVMDEWRKSQNFEDQILMLSDGTGNLAKCFKFLCSLH